MAECSGLALGCSLDELRMFKRLGLFRDLFDSISSSEVMVRRVSNDGNGP